MASKVQGTALPLIRKVRKWITQQITRGRRRRRPRISQHRDKIA